MLNYIIRKGEITCNRFVVWLANTNFKYTCLRLMNSESVASKCTVFLLERYCMVRLLLFKSFELFLFMNITSRNVPTLHDVHLFFSYYGRQENNLLFVNRSLRRVFDHLASLLTEAFVNRAKIVFGGLERTFRQNNHKALLM